MLDFPSRNANVDEMSQALNKFRTLLENKDFNFDRAIVVKFLNHISNEELSMGLIGQVWHYIFRDSTVRRKCKFTGQTQQCLQNIAQRCLRKRDKNSKNMLSMLAKEIERDEFGKECSAIIIKAYIREANTDKHFNELCEFVKGNGFIYLFKTYVL